MISVEDYIGQKFGALTAVEIVDEVRHCDKILTYSIRCKCDCGGERIVSLKQLKSGMVLRCLKRKNHTGELMYDLSGKKFGRLLIVRFVEIKETFYKCGLFKDYMWECVCDCGNTAIIARNRLVGSRQISCGCVKRDYQKIIHTRSLKLPPGEASFNAYFGKYQYNAKKRNIEFELSIEDFRKFCYNNCKYCGISPCRLEPRMATRVNGQILVNGIDRVDTTKGYTLNNCVTSCHKCNLAKGQMGWQEWVDWTNQLTSYQNLKFNG